MSGQPQPQFDLEADDYPLPPIVFDPGEADECERDVAAASYNYSGLMGLGKPKRKKTMALVIDAEELFKANQQLAVNAAQDFADAVKSERVSVLESLGEDETPQAVAQDAAYDAEADFAPGLDDFDDQVDAAVLAWSARTVTFSDEADLIEEAAAAQAAFEARAPQVEPVDETPTESIIERAARLRDSIPVPAEPPAESVRAEPRVASEPRSAPERIAPDVAVEPHFAQERPVAAEPRVLFSDPEPAVAASVDAAPVRAAAIAAEPASEPEAAEAQVPAPAPAPEPAPEPIANHGHALRARIVREPVESRHAAHTAGGRGGLIARFLAWLANLRG